MTGVKARHNRTTTRTASRRSAAQARTPHLQPALDSREGPGIHVEAVGDYIHEGGEIQPLAGLG